MPTKSDLDRETSTFFTRHWQSERLSCAVPRWAPWALAGIPNDHDSGGCYAVFAGDELLYVGVALTPGRSVKIGKARVGLYNRLRRHVVKPESRGATVHKGKDSRWLSMTRVELIAFADEFRYLAAALEIYLISSLRPQHNKAV
jgi:hypothetical protein